LLPSSIWRRDNISEMTIGRLRISVVMTVLSICAATILFFIIAPGAGYPLEFDQGWAMAQVSIPVLAGYLGTATQFASADQNDTQKPAPPLLSWLVFGPVAIYIIGAVSLLIVFWQGNNESAEIGAGMSTSLLSTILTALLGIVTATANVAIAQLFKKQSG
jgi:hypothetical protein